MNRFGTHNSIFIAYPHTCKDTQYKIGSFNDLLTDRIPRLEKEISGYCGDVKVEVRTTLYCEIDPEPLTGYLISLKDKEEEFTFRYIYDIVKNEVIGDTCQEPFEIKEVYTSKNKQACFVLKFE